MSEAAPLHEPTCGAYLIKADEIVAFITEHGLPQAATDGSDRFECGAFAFKRFPTTRGRRDHYRITISGGNRAVTGKNGNCYWLPGNDVSPDTMLKVCLDAARAAIAKRRDAVATAPAPRATGAARVPASV